MKKIISVKQIVGCNARQPTKRHISSVKAILGLSRPSLYLDESYSAVMFMNLSGRRARVSTDKNKQQKEPKTLWESNMHFNIINMELWMEIDTQLLSTHQQPTKPKGFYASFRGESCETEYLFLSWWSARWLSAARISTMIGLQSNTAELSHRSQTISVIC